MKRTFFRRIDSSDFKKLDVISLDVIQLNNIHLEFSVFIWFNG
jgi:hypothetical protein